MCGQHGLLQLLLLSLAVAVCLPGRAGADTDECALIKCDASDQTPVCGSNGVTYASECLFEFARCQTKTTAADTLTLVAHHACRSGSDQSPEDPCARPCSREYRPICASDGRTYNNECLFEIGKCRKVGLSAVKIGPCDE